MRKRWLPFFALFAWAPAINPGFSRAPAQPAPAAAPTIASPLPTDPTTQATPSTTSQAPAPAAGGGEQAGKRAKLLALWDNQRSEEQPGADPPLHRIEAGSPFPYRSLPDSSPAGATLVTVTHAATQRDALIQIARAANVRIGSTRPGLFHTKSLDGFSIDLEQKPLLEAIYETCSRAGWMIESIEPAIGAATTQPASNKPPGKIVLQPAPAKHGVGIWSTTGPFLFEVVSVDHAVDLPVGASGDEVSVEIRTWTEPKLRAFNVARGLSIRAAEDELGHALPARGIDANATDGETKLRLGVPPDCGRRIARLSMVDRCFIQRTSSVIEMKWGDSITAQVIEGMKVSMTTKLDPGTCHVTLTVGRGERSRLDWGDLRLAMSDLFPLLLDTAGAPMQSFHLHEQSGNDPLTIKYSWSNSDTRGRPQPAGKVVLDFPTDVKWVDVPVELRDLPLP